MSPLRARPEGEANSQSITPIRPGVDAMIGFRSWKVYSLTSIAPVERSPFVKATSLGGGDSTIRATSSGTVRVGSGRRRGENRFRCEETVLLSPATKDSVEDCGGGR